MDQDRRRIRSTDFMLAMALVAATLGSAAAVGIVLVLRTAGPSSHVGAASAPRLFTPPPSGKGGGIAMPSSAQISAPSGQVVWALVANEALFRSTDRGNTWEQRPEPPLAGPATDISFVDDLLGWILISAGPAAQCAGESGTIWRTANAGATWQPLTTLGLADAPCSKVISFPDSTHGFLSAWDDNHPPAIYRTSDGGGTWTPSTLPDPSGFVSQGAGLGLRPGRVEAFGGTLLVSADNNQRSYVFRSTDGGATWASLAVVSMAFRGFALVTAARWLNISNGGGAEETTDAGATWHPFTTDYGDVAGAASMFVFGTELVGYGTVRGVIHRTVDGGSHWMMIKNYWP